MAHPLDNPIWNALSSVHQHFAEGDDFARCYPIDMGPLAGMIEPSEAAYQSLKVLSETGRPLFVFLEQPAQPPQDLGIEFTLPLTQMVCEHLITAPQSELSFVNLPDSRAEEMVQLAKLTKPGPFELRTKAMGTYIGILENDKLVAMAGERLKLDGYTEVSAVCTHPDYRGRGYANLLVAEVSRRIIERGEIPFLHSKTDNFSALHVYEQLGFQQRRILHFAILNAKATAATP